MPPQAKRPVINIITVVLNAKQTIQETLDSVRDQDYPLVRHLVVDGNSDDGTQALVSARQADLSYWVSEADNGIYDAMNKGVAAASGDLVLFLNAGDRLYAANTLSEFVHHHYQHNDAALWLCRVLTNDGKLIKPERIQWRSRYKLPVYHQGIIYPLAVLKSHPFSLKYPIASDFHHYNLVSKKLPIRVVPLLLSKFDTQGISSTNIDQLNREFIEIYRDLKLGWLPRAYRRLRILLRR